MILSASPAGFPKDMENVDWALEDVVKGTTASFRNSETGGYIISLSFFPCIYRRIEEFLELLVTIRLALVLVARKEEQRDTSSNGSDDKDGILIKHSFHLINANDQKNYNCVVQAQVRVLRAASILSRCTNFGLAT